MRLTIATLVRLLSNFIALQMASSFRLECVRYESCTIYDLRSSEDFYLYYYFPSRVKEVKYKNLLLVYVRRVFFEALQGVTDVVNIVEPKRLKWVSVSERCNITELHITKAPMKGIDFEKSRTLAVVSLSFTKVTKIPSSVTQLHQLEMFSISFSRLRSINLGAFCDNSKLKSLIFDGNQIRYVYNNAVKECSLYATLEHLHLQNNSLKVVDLKLFTPFKIIYTINIFENKIDKISGTLVNNALSVLEGSSNKLSYVNMCNWTLPKLHTLNLKSNFLQTLPECLENFIGLKYLYLSKNQLTAVTIESFAMLNDLIALYLTSNRLTGNMFTNRRFPKMLQYLFIEGNKLTELDLSSGPVVPLKVKAQNNSISRFDVNRTSPNIIQLLMEGNPLDCSWGRATERQHVKCIVNKL